MLPDRWDSFWRDSFWRDSFWRGGRVLWLLLLAVALLAAGALWAFWDYSRLVSDLAAEAEGRTTRLAAVRIGDELAQFPAALINLARSSAIVSQDPARVQEALHEAPPVEEGLFDAGLLLLNSFRVVTAVEPPRPELLQQDRSARTYFRDLLTNSPASAVFSDAQGDGPAGAPVIAVSVPVIDGEGRFVGALAGLLRLGQSAISPYYATLVKLRVSPDGTAYVIDRSNRILFDSASLREGEQYTAPEAGNGSPNGASAAGAALRVRDAEGRELLVSRAAIPGTPWTLVIEKDWESVAAPTRLYANLLLGLLGLGVILPLTALVLFARQERRGGRRGAAIGRDGQLAQRVEHALLADSPPILPGWEIVAHREPAPAIGRVFHDILLGADGCVTVVLAETSRLGAANGADGADGADGVAEVLSMVGVRTLLRSAARDLLPPAQALGRTNGLLCPDLPRGTLITCLYCRLDPVSGEVAVGNADQVRPLKLPCARGGEAGSLGSSVQLVGAKDGPLGLQLDAVYHEYGVHLAEGDSLFLCSSEVLDVCNGAGESFGRQRLEQVLADPALADAGAKARIAAVTDALRQFAGGKWANDRDAILIVLERLPSGAAAVMTQAG